MGASGSQLRRQSRRPSLPFLSLLRQRIRVSARRPPKTGWTVGGGIESVVPNTQVTWKIEYLYLDLGSAGVNFNGLVFGLPISNVTSVRFTDNIIRVGLNWHLN